MNLCDYQPAAAATAIYPAAAAVTYPALGLAGEVGELVDLLSGPHGPGDRDLLVGELGDVYWYVAALCRDLELTLGVDVVPAGETGGRPVVAGLAVAAGEVAEQVKKTVRDHGGTMPPARRQTTVSACSRLLGLLADVGLAHGVETGEVLDANVAKLSSRAARGALAGDGDRR